MAKKNQKAWVVAVDMGYGHQRAADPLQELAYGKKIINANTYKGIPKKDRKIWTDSRKFYEAISRFKKVPLIGKIAFDIFDYFQEIPKFYPKRDLSDPNMQLRYMYYLIEKHNWGRHLINKLESKPLPLVTTFFVMAFMAEIFDYSHDIYAVVTDTDISRTWVSIDPQKSRIKYLAPSYRAVLRLKRYGVKEENIFLTGFPLPTNLLGDNRLDVLRYDISNRLLNLDPNRKYLSRFDESLQKHLGKKNYNLSKSNHLLTLMFAVGGAGAQRELGMQIVESLQKEIKNKKIRIILVAGTHSDIKNYFIEQTKELGLSDQLGKGVKILHRCCKEDYFKEFNKELKKTDILWTKPSELSFYTALGVPIIMSSPIGSQEKFNRHWLMRIGSGIDQEDPRYTNEWLFDLIKTGWFAEAAMQGFLEAPKFGTINIRKILNQEKKEKLTFKTEMNY